jgi:hypothetical protein
MFRDLDLVRRHASDLDERLIVHATEIVVSVLTDEADRRGLDPHWVLALVPDLVAYRPTFQDGDQ